MSESTEAWSHGGAYEMFMGRWSRRVAEQFVAWLAPGPDLRWLDVGSGTGALSPADPTGRMSTLTGQVSHVHGVSVRGQAGPCSPCVMAAGVVTALWHSSSGGLGGTKHLGRDWARQPPTRLPVLK